MSAWKATTTPGLIQLSEPKSLTRVLLEKYGGPFKNLHVIKLLIVIEIERTKRRDTSTKYLFSLVLKVEGCCTRLQRRSLGQQCWHNVVQSEAMSQQCCVVFANLPVLLNSSVLF